MTHSAELTCRLQSGAWIATDAPRGEPVEIKLRNIGWVSGHIAWATDGRVGIAFDRPINPKDARNPVNTGALDLPLYLQRLNTTPPVPGKLTPRLNQSSKQYMSTGTAILSSTRPTG